MVTYYNVFRRMTKLYTKINKRFVGLLTLSQVASKLKLSRQAILKRINGGRYRAVRINYDTSPNHRVYLIPITELKK